MESPPPAPCGVCDEVAKAAFACPRCAYRACDACSTRWFDSRPLSVPSCMNCKAAFRPEDLAGCFSTAAARARFENARRAALLSADQAYDLPTMLTLMPKVRALKELQDALFGKAASTHELELAHRELEREEFEVNMRNRSVGKPCDATLRKGVREAKNAKGEAESALEQQRSSHNAAFLNLSSMRQLVGFAAPVAAAVPEAAAAPVAKPRYARCAADGCAGAFLTGAAADGLCAVCEAKHCTACLVLADVGHVCLEADRATARFMLLHTKACPRCRAAIQRSSGCPQMMCTSCTCIFDWNTGLETAGVVHNPHFYQLAAEERQRVEADRAARGLTTEFRPRPALCQQREFDPLCEPFESGVFRDALDAAGRALNVREELMVAYRLVLHAEREEVPQLLEKLANSGGERATRLARLRRLAGKVLGPVVAEVTHTQQGHPDGFASLRLYRAYEPVLTDGQYAGLLMRNDTLRGKMLQTLEVHETYNETAKDLLRAVLVATPAERPELVVRVHEFVRQRRQLLDKAAEPKTHKRPADASGAASGPGKVKK